MKKCLTLLLFFTLFFSCQDTNDNPPDNEVTVKGNVLSIIDYTPLASATVSIGNASATSNAEGAFSITTISINENDQLLVSCKGFIPYQKPLVATENGTLTFELLMLPVGVTREIDPAETNTITTPEGASVAFPALPDINEKLEVSVTYIDAGTDMLAAAPGDFTGYALDGSDVTLISKGMVQVDITGAETGDSYTLAGMGEYELTIPIADNLTNVPNSIPLWYFDTNEGLWIEEGSATREGDSYKGTVTHFTTWNADQKMPERTCISGIINDPDPADDESYTIELQFAGFYRTFTQKDLTFTIINIPQNTEMTVTVRKNSSNDFWIKNIVTSDSSECLDTGTFPGEGYLYEVKQLQVVAADGAMDLSWQDPDQEGFESVKITYTLLGEDPANPQTITIPKGTESATLTGLTEGYYRVVVQAQHATGNSIGHNRTIKISDQLGLIIAIINQSESNPNAPNYDPDQLIQVSLNGSSDWFYYTDPLLLPPGTEVMLAIRPEYLEEITSYQCEWWNDHDGYYTPGTTLEFTMEDDDYDISFYYNTCFY